MFKNAINMNYSHGCYLVSDQNQEYLDLTSGTFNLSLGYQNKYILTVVKAQLDRLVHCSSSFEVDSVVELQQRLLACSNSSFDHAHTKVCSGSTAMEGAIKYAMYNTGRREVITFRRSHHGQTFFTMSMSGFSFRSEISKCQNQIAAIVIEPILGNGGGYVCSRSFLHELREFCTDHEICLIFDEVQTYFGMNDSDYGIVVFSNGKTRKMKSSDYITIITE